jgi:hypothetical protein
MLTRNLSCTITCERFYPGQPPACSAKPIELDHAPDAAELAALLAERGYVSDDHDRHWCKRHDPAFAGTIVELGSEYRQIAPGVWARASGPTSVLGLESLFGTVRIDVRTVEPGTWEGCDGQQ